MEKDPIDDQIDNHFSTYMAIRGGVMSLLVRSVTTNNPADVDSPRIQAFIEDELEAAAMDFIKPLLQAAFITACEIQYRPASEPGSLSKLTRIFFPIEPPPFDVLWYCDTKTYCYFPKPNIGG